jgi:hypothetical protein
MCESIMIRVVEPVPICSARSIEGTDLPPGEHELTLQRNPYAVDEEDNNPHWLATASGDGQIPEAWYKALQRKEFEVISGEEILVALAQS